MGGCRCTFPNCTSSTVTTPKFHFFHFPVRDMERCKKWAKMTNNMPFMELPISKLRNKVICEAHFKDHCFMNILKESLTKTAVPSLVVLPDKQVIDLEEDSNADLAEILESLNSIPPAPSAASTALINARKRPLIEQVFIKDGTKDNIVVDLEIKEINPPELIPCDPLPKPSPPKIRKFGPSKAFGETRILNSTLLLNSKLDKPKILNHDPNEITISSSNTETFDVVEKQYNNSNLSQHQLIADKEVIVEAVRTGIRTSELLTRKLYFEKCNEHKRDIASISAQICLIQKKQDEIITRQTISPPDSTTKTNAKPEMAEPKSKFNTNKLQLFNGIKKYLSPAMVTLLKIELFGNSDREWKSDEKNVIAELLGLGSNVYEFMRDEWRFRFPPKKEVEKWLNARESELNDEDE